MWGFGYSQQGLFAKVSGEVHDLNVKCTIDCTKDNVGGIVGSNSGLIENCTVEATIVTQDNDHVGGICGLNNKNMIMNSYETIDLNDDIGCSPHNLIFDLNKNAAFFIRIVKKQRISRPFNK